MCIAQYVKKKQVFFSCSKGYDNSSDGLYLQLGYLVTVQTDCTCSWVTW